MKKMPIVEVKSCGVLIVRNNPPTSFLLMKHVDRWDLPKGHVDAGETDLECALRELVEETGISASDIELDPEFQYVNHYYVQNKRTGGKKKLKALIIYLAELTNEEIEINLTEHIGYEWWDWNPPHKIQKQTIDPLLEAVASHFAQGE